MSTHDLHECFNMALNFVDIRVKICLSTNEQIKEVEGFCERYKISHSEDTVKLRRHFNDLLHEVG